MKAIGIIGGMGPGATLDLFQKIINLTPAQQDQDHLHLIIDNFPQIPDRTSFLMGEGETPLPHLLMAAERLEQAGVKALCMSCNTAHYFVENIREKISVPFISIIESTLEKIKSDYPDAKKIGLMATRGTCESRIYHDVLIAAGLGVLPMSEEFKMNMMDIIYTVKSGLLTEKLELFKQCIEQMKEAGADVLIAGCTEIPLLLPHFNSPVPFIDPTLALAENVIKFALEEPEFRSDLALSAMASA